MSVPSQFYLRVVHGIVGGFAPREPTAVKSVAYTPDTNILQISSSPSADFTSATVQKDGSVDELVNELKSILKKLPTENPPGSEDIYGMDTSIMWGSDDLEWTNTCGQGCGGHSSVQATDEEKAKFKKALEIADKLVAKGKGS